MLYFLAACTSLSLYEYKVAGDEESVVPAAAPDMGSDGVELVGFIDPAAEASSDMPDVAPGDIAFATATHLSVAALQVTGDLSFLDAVEVYAEAPGEGEVLVATTVGPLAGRGPIDLELEDVDLGPYLSTGEASFPARAWGDAPAQDTTLYVEWSLTIGVTAQGIASAADAS